MMQLSKEFAGVDKGAPMINSEGLAAYDPLTFLDLLQSGLTTTSDVVGGEMAAVIEHTKLLTPEDQQAYAAFMLRNNKPAEGAAAAPAKSD